MKYLKLGFATLLILVACKKEQLVVPSNLKNAQVVELDVDALTVL